MMYYHDYVDTVLVFTHGDGLRLPWFHLLFNFTGVRFTLLRIMHFTITCQYIFRSGGIIYSFSVAASTAIKYIYY